MEMFLTLLAMSLLVTVVSAALFAAATREGRRPPAPRAETPRAEAGRFFVSGAGATDPASVDVPGVEGPLPEPVPLETLLLQIERHIRLEQAAAESFHGSPNGESLHTRTSSPLVN